MTNHPKESNEFYEALKQEKETRQRQLLENPEKEQNRLNWLRFKNTIETKWLPILEEYLTVLGRLWFGYEMRLKGPEFMKELVACPSFVVAYEVFGPMAVFWVAQNVLEKREAPYSDNEFRTELFKRGYRCRVVMKDDGQYHFQDDDHNTLVQFDDVSQVNGEKLLAVFAEAHSKGPSVIYRQWKNVGIGDDR